MRSLPIIQRRADRYLGRRNAVDDPTADLDSCVSEMTLLSQSHLPLQASSVNTTLRFRKERLHTHFPPHRILPTRHTPAFTRTACAACRTFITPYAHRAVLVKMPPASLQPTTILIHVLTLATLSNGRRHDAPRPCKVVPGDADWPSQGAWARLDESLGGGLLQPAPAGAVCHPGRREYDAGRCAAVAAAWETHGFHADDPSFVQWNQFADDSCLPDRRYPCDGGGYPAFVVNASGVEDVRRGVDFGKY